MSLQLGQGAAENTFTEMSQIKTQTLHLGRWGSVWLNLPEVILMMLSGFTGQLESYLSLE